MNIRSLEDILNTPDPKLRETPDLGFLKGIYKKPCPKCGGTGFLPNFIHVQNGKCFECKGKGKV